jgi:hypothetical protein
VLLSVQATLTAAQELSCLQRPVPLRWLKVLETLRDYARTEQVSQSKQERPPM